MAATRGRLSACVASSFDAVEVSDLSATAEALPAGWIVQVTPPHGQLAMLPRRYAHAYHRALVADGELRVVYRANGLTGLRVPAIRAQ